MKSVAVALLVAVASSQANAQGQAAGIPGLMLWALIFVVVGVVAYVKLCTGPYPYLGILPFFIGGGAMLYERLGCFDISSGTKCGGLPVLLILAGGFFVSAIVLWVGVLMASVFGEGGK